ncbi:MAG: UDP-N-acetylmuramate dehydrogenase [Bacteroidales bacterium]|nr:UDP-N-acetylmuramate dehydrogenase [Bacteroidales bacterium]
MKIVENPSLLTYNTFGIDVKARRLVEVEDAAELCRIEEWEHPLLLGRGSDMVFTADYEGTVVRLAEECEGKVKECDGGLSVWGGMVLDELVEHNIAEGYYGLENLSGVPGTVGAGVVQNVGAYGVEIGDVVQRVEVYDRQQCDFHWLNREECRFGYRNSVFKQQGGRYVVVRVELRLGRKFEPCLRYRAVEALPRGTAAEWREALLALRWSKLPKPEEYGSAGSFFKNPVVGAAKYEELRSRFEAMPEGHRVDGIEVAYKISAAWLIDQAGWKGRKMGRVGVWPQQALVLYNAGHCVGSEVVALAAMIRHDVREKFGVELEPEAIII